MIKFMSKSMGWLLWMIPTAVFAGHHPGVADALPASGQESQIDVSQIEPLTTGQAIFIMTIIAVTIIVIWWFVRMAKKNPRKKGR